MPSSRYSDSSSRSSKGSRGLRPVQRRKTEQNLSNVQNINVIESGEEGLELLVTIISMTMTLKSKGKMYLTALLSDGDNFAMLDTSVDAHDRFTVVASMTDYKNRTFLLRNITSWAYPKKANLGDVKVGFLFSERSSIAEVTNSEYLIRDCFSKYRPQLKFVLPADAKLKKVKELDVKQLKKPTKVTIEAKVTGVTQEVKTVADGRDVILTKVQIEMDNGDDGIEIASWGHLGVFLGCIMEEYIDTIVGFADIEASTWSGRTSMGINLAFGQESKIRLPSKAPRKRLMHAKLPKPPTSIQDIGGFEGRTLRMFLSGYIWRGSNLTTMISVDISLQLVKPVEEIDDDRWFTIAGDKDRHKVQVYFGFDAQELNKGDTIAVKSGLISQSGKVLNLTIEKVDDIEVLTHPLIPGLVLGDLMWCGTKIKKELASPQSVNTTPKTASPPDRPLCEPQSLDHVKKGMVL